MIFLAFHIFGSFRERVALEILNKLLLCALWESWGRGTYWGKSQPNGIPPISPDRVKAAKRQSVSVLYLSFVNSPATASSLHTLNWGTIHTNFFIFHSAAHCRHLHRRGWVRGPAGFELGPRPPVPLGGGRVVLEAAAAVRQAGIVNSHT